MFDDTKKPQGWDDPDAIKNMLKRQIAELEMTVNPMLRGGANPDDNEDLRGQMMKLESLRKILNAEEDDNE